MLAGFTYLPRQDGSNGTCFELAYDLLVLGVGASSTTFGIKGVEEHCLQFHRTQRTIQTASLVQVRRPLYRTSVARWRHYDKYLQPLKAVLGQGGVASTQDRGLSCNPA